MVQPNYERELIALIKSTNDIALLKEMLLHAYKNTSNEELIVEAYDMYIGE